MRWRARFIPTTSSTRSEANRSAPIRGRPDKQKPRFVPELTCAPAWPPTLGPMRSILVALLATASLTAAAQQNPPTTFRSSVTLVAVDVSVLDKDGRPVPGLTADDFHIKL